MNKKPDSSKMVARRKQESAEKRDMVIQTILQMVENREAVTFYSVQKKTGVSKSFLYQSPDIRKLIEKHRPKQCVEVPMDERDTLIKNLRQQIQKLEKENEWLKKDESWHDKYDKLLQKHKELEKQLETAYKF